MSQEVTSSKTVRFFSYALSMFFHLGFLIICILFYPSKPSFGSSASRPVLLRLGPIPSYSTTPLSVIPKEIMIKGAQPIVKPNDSVSPVKSLPLKNEWDEKVFKKKQAQIDQKIRLIRAKLYRAVKQNQRASKKTRDFQVISVNEKNMKSDDYLAALRRKVLEKWSPLLVHAEGKFAASEVRIDFTLTKDGVLQSFQVGEWKGSEKFRDLSLEALKQASPFSPLPHEIFWKKSELFPISLFFYYQ